MLYARDRTETTAQVWLGLTAGCAVCHDHKFDAITMKDFYSLAAFFNNTTQAAMDGNIKDTPPILMVPKPEDRPRWETLARMVGDARSRSEARKKEARADFDKWLAAAKADQISSLIPTEALRLHAKLSEGEGKKVSVDVDGKARSLPADGAEWTAGKIAAKALTLRPGTNLELKDVGDFEKDQGFSCGMWVKIPKRGQVGALVARMDNGNAFRGWDMWIQADRVGMHIVSKWQEDALKAVAKTPLQPGKWTHV